MYTPLTSSVKAKSEYTPLTWNQAHDELEEGDHRIYALPRDQSYEEITEGKCDQEYEEIEDVHPYELVQPYEQPVKKEKPYDEPDTVLDKPLESPIYIVPDPEEQKKMDYSYYHFDTRSTDINGEHNVSVAIAS